MSVRGNAKRKQTIPVIGLKSNGPEVIPVTGSKQKDPVPVRGHART